MDHLPKVGQPMPFNSLRTPLIFALLAWLTGCGGGASSNGSSSSPNSTQGPQPAAATSLTASGPSASIYEEKSFVLSWVAPTTRVDGSSLAMSEIGGYEISYIDSNNTSTNVLIDDPLRTEVTLANLSPNNYLVYIFTFDQQNRLSPVGNALKIGVQSFLR